MSAISDEMTSRDFIIKVAESINKKASDVEKIILILEENWIENVGALRELDDQQWKEMKIPLGLVNSIKKVLNNSQAP